MNERDYENEPATSTAIANVVSDGDPDQMLMVLEKKAAVAGRMRQAIETVVISQTYPQDWNIQGDKACLASAGAERIGRNFPIAFRDVTWKKEEFSDASGAGYRYVYTCYATLYDRTVYAEGSYSTRDEFLGKKGGEWRPLEDINEGDVRSAAHHICCGNAIKELLGLRGLPAAEYQRIMKGTGREPTKSPTVQRGKGTKGGTDPNDGRHQQELTEICMAIANSAQNVQLSEDGKQWLLVPLSDSDARDSVEIAKSICIALSGFTGKDGKSVLGKLSKQLQGKWLVSTIGKARKLKEALDSQQPAGEEFPGE